MIRKQIYRAGWTAIVLLVLTSCRLEDTRQVYPEDKDAAQQQQAISQSEKHEDLEAGQGLPRGSAVGNAGAPGRAGASGRIGAPGNTKVTGGARLEEPGVAVSTVQSLGARNQLMTDRFFKAGDIRHSLFFELIGEGQESERFKCVFTLPDEIHTSYYGSMRSVEVLTERGKGTHKITLETMGEILRVPTLTYTIKFATDDEADPHILVKDEEGLAGAYYLFESGPTLPDVFSCYLSRADPCLWPAENL